MEVTRIVLRKVTSPKLLIEINLEYDHKDGTTEVIQIYGNPKTMRLDVNNEMVSMDPQNGDTTYTTHYSTFRDNLNGSFSSAQGVHDYVFVKASEGYSPTLQRIIPQGARLYV